MLGGRKGIYLRHKFSSLWSGQLTVPSQNMELFKHKDLSVKHGDCPSGHTIITIAYIQCHVPIKVNSLVRGNVAFVIPEAASTSCKSTRNLHSFHLRSTHNNSSKFVEQSDIRLHTAEFGTHSGPEVLLL